MEKIGFALFGAGKWGKNYERLLKETGGVSLEAVVTKSSGDLEKVLKNPRVDCVIIATPPSTHFEIAKAALEAGKHVLVEKPMVLNMQEAEGLKETLRQAQGKFQRNLVLMVGFQYLYNDYIRYLKDAINEKRLGKIQIMEAEHLLSPEREDVDSFWDAAPHALSIYQFLFNPGGIKNVSGKYSRESTTAFVKFENSPPLKIVASWTGPEKTRKIRVIGDKAVAVLDETKDANKLEITGFKRKKIPEIKISEPLHNELEHFIDYVKTGIPPLTDVNFGFNITAYLKSISDELKNPAPKREI